MSKENLVYSTVVVRIMKQIHVYTSLAGALRTLLIRELSKNTQRGSIPFNDTTLATRSIMGVASGVWLKRNTLRNPHHVENKRLTNMVYLTKK